MALSDSHLEKGNTPFFTLYICTENITLEVTGDKRAKEGKKEVCLT